MNSGNVKKQIHPTTLSQLAHSSSQVHPNQTRSPSEATLPERSDTLDSVANEKMSQIKQSKEEKIERPSARQTKPTAADAKSSFLASFFNKSYRPPGFSATMASLRDQAFQSNLPFLFVVCMEKDDESGVIANALPCSTFYDKVDSEDTREIFGETHVYMVKSGASQIEALGSINSIESDSNPLGFHLFLLNNEQFSIEDPENLRGETLAAVSILFRLGTCVAKDDHAADRIRSLIAPEDRDFHFGRVMIDALVEHDYVSAEACLSYGGQVQSVDDHGHLAISCALQPGAERFLEKMLIQTAKQEDLPLLQAELEDGRGDLNDGIVSILQKHIARLSQTNIP